MPVACSRCRIACTRTRQCKPAVPAEGSQTCDTGAPFYGDVGVEARVRVLQIPRRQRACAIHSVTQARGCARLSCAQPNAPSSVALNALLHSMRVSASVNTALANFPRSSERTHCARVHVQRGDRVRPRTSAVDATRQLLPHMHERLERRRLHCVCSAGVQDQRAAQQTARTRGALRGAPGNAARHSSATRRSRKVAYERRSLCHQDGSRSQLPFTSTGQYFTHAPRAMFVVGRRPSLIGPRTQEGHSTQLAAEELVQPYDGCSQVCLVAARGGQGVRRGTSGTSRAPQKSLLRRTSLADADSTPSSSGRLLAAAAVPFSAAAICRTPPGCDSVAAGGGARGMRAVRCAPG